MKALKIVNLILAVALIATAFTWFLKGGTSVGGLTALALPAATFITAFAALQQTSRPLATAGLWLNATLLTVLLLVDALALFVFNTRIASGAAIIVFQAVFILFPASANIAALRTKRLELA